MARASLPPFSLFPPPYRQYLPVAPEEGFASSPHVLRGVALVWSMAEGHAPRDLDAAAGRPGGLPLVLILPPAATARRLRGRILEAVEHARPQSVLPYHPRPAPEELVLLLRGNPEELPGELVDFLLWRGLPLDQETRRIVRRTVELAAELRTLSALARGVYLSRRALGRRFRGRGLPVPSHWLQFCRLLHATIRLQERDASLFRVAASLGYPDGFTLSNQMMRLVGVRPSTARERLGWEWFVEAWLRREAGSGGLRVRLPGLAAPVAGNRGPEADPTGPSRDRNGAGSREGDGAVA